LESKSTIEREIKRECRYFAYPNGTRADIAGAQDALRAARYDFAFTTVPTFTSRSQNRLSIGRVVIPDRPSVNEFRMHVSMLHSTVKSWLGTKPMPVARAA
jgi:hypothetical protein